MSFAALNSAGNVLYGANTGQAGTVYALSAQPQGGIIVGGDFDMADQAVRHNLLRLLPNGTLDPQWNPGANGQVYSLAVDSAGAVYAGGLFSASGGQSCPSIVKLAGTGSGTADPNWKPSVPNGYVTALTAGRTGAVYAGGTYFPLVKITGSTGLVDLNWRPTPDNSVYALAVNSSGDVITGGAFSMFSQPGSLPFLAKLAGSGTGAPDPSWKPSPNDSVFALSVAPSGAIYIGGKFASVGNIQRSHIARVVGDGTGALDPWYPEADGYVYSLATDRAGSVFAGGYFLNIGGASRSNIAKLSAQGTGAADLTWNPGADSAVLALAIDAGGTIYAGGAFTTMGGVPRGGIAAFFSDEIFKDGFE